MNGYHAKAPHPHSDVRAEPWEGVHHLRVLVVEGDIEPRRLLAVIFDTWECAVEAVSTARAAREVAERVTFDLLLCNVDLPDGSGLELMRHWRATTGRPGIALADYYTADDLRQCRDAGFSCCLAKPFRLHQLDECIRAALAAAGEAVR